MNYLTGKRVSTTWGRSTHDVLHRAGDNYEPTTGDDGAIAKA